MSFRCFRNGGFFLVVGLFKVEAVAGVTHETPFYKHGWFEVGWGEDTLLDFGKR